MPGPSRKIFKKKGAWKKKKEVKRQPEEAEELAVRSVDSDDDQGSAQKKVRWDTNGSDEESGREGCGKYEDSANDDIQITDDKASTLHGTESLGQLTSHASSRSSLQSTHSSTSFDVILSLIFSMLTNMHIRSFRVGCAYYDPVKQMMYVLEDIVESSHYDTTRLCEHYRIP